MAKRLLTLLVIYLTIALGYACHVTWSAPDPTAIIPAIAVFGLSLYLIIECDGD